MASQPGYTYTETFADISNWTFNTATSPGDGTFVSGIGASAWKGYEPTGSGSIPNATRLTHSTTFFQVSSGNVTSSGIYRQTQSFSLLSTGTSDNSTSIAVDLFLNFTGLNAGTLSFDWASLNNSTGNRTGSVRIYTSVDGITFTELTSAAVLNVVNNSPTSGQVKFVALPASFNNNANARIRFYYYNGSGGTTGARPKVQIDNVSVTAVPSNVCTAPAAAATNLQLSPGYSAMTGTFTASSPASDGYVVIRSLNNSLSAPPANGTNYAVGDNVGDGTVISVGNSTSFTASSLSPSTVYYYFVYSMNNLCSGGPLYNTANVLTGNATTLSGNTPCAAPAVQASNLVLSNVTSSGIKGTFTGSSSVNADKYLVVRSTSSSLSATPVNGTQYAAGATLGTGVVVSKTGLTSFNATGLNPGTQYYFFVFAVNEDNCTSGPAYNTVSPATAVATTVSIPVCSTPSAQPTNLQLSASNTSINGYFTASASADGYLVVYSTSSTLGSTPQSGTSYNVGASFGSGIVVSNGSATSFVLQNLNASTTYYFFVFAKNQLCTGGPLYLAAGVLQANVTTTATATLSVYFGNLHAHSAYSDGNQDNSGYTPANDFTFAKSSQCMDFLGISEHNHSEAGMNVSRWQPGITQAAAATTGTFLAMYGMEWGVISNGGHVLVYGIDQLLGWETGNYNVYVPKSDYTGKPSTTGTTGLFKTVNDWPSTAFTMLAHPDNSDFNNIAGTAFNTTADSAIAGCAVESGPAFSTNTSYTDPASRLSNYWYYKRLLAKGYHVGPNIDHDNHYTTYGRTNYSRLAVLSPTLTKTDFLQAIKKRQFYATHDCDTRASFTLNNQVMGSITSGTTYPAISIYVIDPTRPSTMPKIRLMYGIPGNMVDPVAIDSVNGNTFNYTDFNMADGTAYYYAEITIGSDYVITSPVWYTKSTVTPLQLLSFDARAVSAQKVQLNWRTVNEVNCKSFVLQKSADGINFHDIASVAAKNTPLNNYSSNDDRPFKGGNYYRLQMIDMDGSTRYSNVVFVSINSANNTVSIQPNPVNNTLRLQMNFAAAGTAKFRITDAMGRTFREQQTQLNAGEQVLNINTSSLTSGAYYLVVELPGEQIVRPFIRQ